MWFPGTSYVVSLYKRPKQTATGNLQEMLRHPPQYQQHVQYTSSQLPAMSVMTAEMTRK